jgi:FKBP-type peptidyl-prolyl cis-trans isomerase
MIDACARLGAAAAAAMRWRANDGMNRASLTDAQNSIIMTSVARGTAAMRAPHGTSRATPHSRLSRASRPVVVTAARRAVERERVDADDVSPPTTRRAALIALGTARDARAKQDQGCESCSDSNSALSEGDKAFKRSESGLRFLDLKVGEGALVETSGTKVVVDWSGYTSGYQAKKIESTRETDEPFVFTLGDGTAIPAFDEAVRGMRVGGVRRIEIPGELEEKLGYSRNKALRYNGVGPKPSTFGGQRALDFVLDNETLRDFNRSLLFDVRLSSVRK